MTRNKVLFGILFSFTLLLGAPCSAAEIHENYVFEGWPAESQVAAWSKLPAKHSFVLNLGDPDAYALRNVSKLENAQRVQIEVASFPREDTLHEWKQLAKKGVEFIALDAGLPTEEEVKRLNEIDFPKLTFVLTKLPMTEECQRLSAIQGKVSLIFALGVYPRFSEKPVYLAIPSYITLTFAADYWPWYSHMDVLNMIPHKINIRVSGSFPPDANMPYILNIKRLSEITIETDFDPSDQSIWNQFQEHQVKWANKGRVPSSPSLKAFEESETPAGNRKLIIDSDYPLQAEEKSRLTASPLDVEWVHTAP
ncbi:MAG: hypothetical protein A3K03_09405 [Bdellovibrionales bacterium RIFOXYD1_FULL_44_7]|nr:MAG: hypothetical protein A3K03_09405 [Bdellovibrionales bacterium RIFOXYD1_FULL_44_7]